MLEDFAYGRFKGNRLQIEAVGAYNRIASTNEAPPYDPKNIDKNNKEWCVLAAKTIHEMECNRLDRVQTGELPPTDEDAREQANLDELPEDVQLQMAKDLSLAGQQAPASGQQPAAEKERPGASEDVEQGELDRRLIERVLQESRESFAAQFGRQAEAPVAIRPRDPAELEREQQERRKREEERDAGKGKGPESPPPEPPIKKKRKPQPPPGGSSRPEGAERSPSPPHVPPRVDPPIGASRQPTVNDPLGTDRITPEVDKARNDRNMTSSDQSQKETIDTEFNKDPDFPSEQDTIPVELLVGPQSAASLAETVLDARLHSDEEAIRNSETLQRFAKLTKFQERPAPTELPLPYGRDLLPSELRDSTDPVFGAISATAEQLLFSQNPSGMDSWGPGGRPGGGGPPGSPSGGGEGGGGSPGSTNRGRDNDNDEVPIMSFMRFYDQIALDHPDVLLYIRWPSRLVEFNRWVLEKWPVMYIYNTWPRNLPLGSPRETLEAI
ncbi:hypothetical protein R1flu_016510 [Riccia fluitans]|uniref:Uncharacterized protein n=1 Tax=Riccia fluitans TaxID=41844 RepID=A0ABD1YQ60_9MARC